ncbi:MAG: chemotaxis protein CheW [Myxococcota bacterium]
MPLSPPAVLGVFNLRGAPVALVDTARVLDLPGAGASLPAAGHSATALVIRRASTILAGLLIDRMDSVIGLEQGAFTPRDWAAEHAAVGGFLELAARKLVITLFDSNAVVERIHALKYR